MSSDLKEPQTDSVEALGQKVAELCGCQRYKRPWDGRVFLCREQPGTKEQIWNVTHDPVDVVNSDVPKYTSDLNACAEFEKGLDGTNQYRYALALNEVIFGPHGRVTWPPMFEIITATAEQRCRAFVALHEGAKI